jgi:tryptophan synthase alpha chain
MSRITELYKKKQQKILNVYCTAGFPQLDDTFRVMRALQQNGADMIEVGMPYSDPLADGPVIQHSSTIALRNGMTIKKLFEQLKDFRKSPAEGGIGGAIPVLLILPDLPEYEYETEYGAIIKKHRLDFVFLVAPETAQERVRKLDELSTGFLYAVSSSSTTGREKNMSDVKNYLQKLEQLKLKNPVLVGFGIKDKQTFDAACEHASGAIIGTAFIKALEQYDNIEQATKEFLSAVISRDAVKTD